MRSELTNSEREPLLPVADQPIRKRHTSTRRVIRDESCDPLATQETKKTSFNRIVVLSSVLVGAIILIVSAFIFAYNRPHFEPSRITSRAFKTGLKECRRIEGGLVLPPAKRLVNPRFDIQSSSQKPVQAAILLTSATLLDGDGTIRGGMSIFMLNGVIHAVSDKPLIPSTLASEVGILVNEINTIDLANHYTTPGLVDMHSHAGTDSWPALVASDDTNEMTSTPTTPFIRAIDGFNPEDPAIRIINAGGVTSSLILPGSGNLIGGEALMIKHRIPHSNRVQDMLVYANANQSTDGRLWRHMKMACGENPKDVYGAKQMPGSRLGEGFLFREQFNAAKVLREEQDDWCTLAESAHKHMGNRAHSAMHSIYPVNIRFDSLVALLRGEVKLQNHCYETEDLEMMIRHSHEYGYKITAFHHALEAFKVADLLAKENISTAIFADLFGYKKEAYGASTQAAQVLTAAGANVAFKSDHPVLNAQHLIFEAQKAHHYGLDGVNAIRAVTSIPAENMGVSQRIGYVRPGYDADLVVWDRHPLSLGATPLKVFVDGHVTFMHGAYNTTMKSAQAAQKNADVDVERIPTVPDIVCGDLFGDSVVLTNISSIYVDAKSTLTDLSLSIVITKGVITCFGSSCDTPKFANQIDMNGGVVTPGLVLGMTHLGLEEISAEEGTKDGISSGFDKSGGARAVDGLKLGLDASLLLTSAFKAGVLGAVAAPRGNGVLLGQAVSFRLGEDDDVTGVAVVIGQSAKDKGESGSISGQISMLRAILKESVRRIYSDKRAAENVFDQVLLGKKFLFVHIDESNAIQHVIRLKREIQELILELHGRKVAVKMTLIGGAEAWKVASLLSEENVGVMLVPARCTPGKWESRSCILPNGVGIGQSFINNNNHIAASYPSAHILTRSGVKVGLGFEEDNFARGLIWEAGWIYQDSMRAASVLGGIGLSASEVLGMVSWNVAEILGVGKRMGSIAVGEYASLVGYNVDPIRGYRNSGGLSSHVKVVVSGQHGQCNPRQY